MHTVYRVQDRNQQRVTNAAANMKTNGKDANELVDTGYTSTVTGRGNKGEELDAESAAGLEKLARNDEEIDEVNS
jgi:hypothetical protein